METRAERNWTAQIVIASEHVGLAPLFKSLEHELYRVLARVDDPKMVAAYLRFMRGCSNDWLATFTDLASEK